VEDELLEGASALGYDEEPVGRSPGGKDLLDRAAAGDEFLVGS